MGKPAERWTPEDLVQAASGLAPGELEQLVRQLLALRAERQSPRLSDEETQLLGTINQAPSPAARERRRQLAARLRSQELTLSEQEELLRLTDESEQLDARRAEALARLAALRGKPLAVVMDELGLRHPPIEGLV